MSNTFFQFKYFCIHHDRCAMKVGTDGVLLGAWGNVEGKRILDIGTGTGLIALMAAQRNPQAMVLGIDIDEEAVLQAQENISESPFVDRVKCVSQNILTFSPQEPFDAILCNPPFFTEDTLPNTFVRSIARNSSSLPFPQLIKKITALLSKGGMFSVIIPSGLMQEFVSLCLVEGLYLNRRCMVRTKANKPPKRVMLTFSDETYNVTEESEICLTDDKGKRSQEYNDLTESFYLSETI
ncbi:MAG: methyltransferase [Bacteroidaceae bacterium]|nr:methyltransferase [Bacteroidaceae bacterium]